MATIKVLSIVPEQHRGGWDVGIELSNATKKENMVFYWSGKDKPDDKILEQKFQYFSNQFDEVEPTPEKIYTESEVVKVLVEKKYLVVGQKLSDLPVKSIAAVEEVVK